VQERHASASAHGKRTRRGKLTLLSSLYLGRALRPNRSVKTALGCLLPAKSDDAEVLVSDIRDDAVHAQERGIWKLNV